MAAMSSGRKSRPARVIKGGTVSTRKHRFESFNQRIAKLNIDPIRRVRRNDVEKDDLASNTSYFKAGLAHWRDLNLSENFTGFVHEVEPLCDSLPQIVHYQQRIMGILVKYIERRDVLSLEPLLSLLDHLAHDLGTRFESHFSKAVTLVASLAAKHSDVEVIEWSFTCLAWLFKYLSRLLVPDLRPLYDIMAPLLGKEPQKLHTTRFAAEAMSFLIRKAALAYHKNQAPLAIIIHHAFNDLRISGGNSKNVQLYQTGLMTLFSDAITGIGRELHSCGAALYRCLLGGLVEQENIQISACTEVLNGITVNLIHHTDAETFKPLLDSLLETSRSFPEDASMSIIAILARLLYIATAVRKGSRIQDWEPILGTLLALLQKTMDHENSPLLETIPLIEKAVAVVFQYSPLDVILPKLRPTMELLVKNRDSRKFMAFCSYFTDFGRERFQSLLAPHFFRYVAFTPSMIHC